MKSKIRMRVIWLPLLAFFLSCASAQDPCLQYKSDGSCDVCDSTSTWHRYAYDRDGVYCADINCNINEDYTSLIPSWDFYQAHTNPTTDYISCFRKFAPSPISRLRAEPVNKQLLQLSELQQLCMGKRYHESGHLDFRRLCRLSIRLPVFTS